MTSKINEIQLIEGKITVVTGLHIGAGDTEMHIGGTDNSVIKNAVTDEPYIPGSSLKGKMRSLLRLYEGTDDNGDHIVKLFGAPAGKESKDVKPSCLSFWDCFLTPEWKSEIIKKQMPYTEVKMENKISRATGTAEHPRTMERVLPGAEFGFKLTVKIYEGENRENIQNLVLKTLKLLEMDALGGSGSRGYGRIKFKDLKMGEQDIQSELDKMKLF